MIEADLLDTSCPSTPKQVGDTRQRINIINKCSGQPFNMPSAGDYYEEYRRFY